ncbi:MAG: hypothetical protein ACI4NP_06235 [Thermoguttaceae bacterium]
MASLQFKSFQANPQKNALAQGIFFFCVWALLVGVCQNAADAQENTTQDQSQESVVYFPMETADHTTVVYASPSSQSYQVGKLPAKSKVEVYFRTNDGFCAIRPPKGSFSWINSRFVELETSTSGHILSPSGKAIPSRVGGASPAVSSAVQVGLKDNQSVKVLGEISLEDGSIWYKIAPPPGEFRWIPEDALSAKYDVAQLPEKLTRQSQYGVASANEKNDDSTQYSAANQEDSPRVEEDFQKQVARLNNDVVNALQNANPSQQELLALQARAEKLFDRAPSDADRFVVQSIFDAIVKAQIRQNQASLQTPSANVAPLDGYSSASMAQSINTPNLFNGEYIVGPILDQDGIPVDPSLLNGAFFSMAPDAANATALETSAPKEEGSKSKMEFAFSSVNNPFARSKTAIRNRSSRMESSLSHLLPERPTQIVPPANYNFFDATNARKTLAQNVLKPGPLRGDAVVPAHTSQPTAKELGENATALASRQPRWSPVGTLPSEVHTSVVQFASNEEKEEGSNRIRQTNSFAPVTSRSFDNHDTSGTLIELPEKRDGAPRYALIAPEGDAFDVVAYVDPGKNVSFNKFIGQKVVVKGVTGTISIDGRNVKHVVVSSLFLMK